MASPLVHHVAARAARRIPLLKRLPVLQLLLLGEVVLIAKTHYERLSPRERRRLVTLLREGRMRPSNLSERQRRELEAIIEKADASGFVTAAARKLAPV